MLAASRHLFEFACALPGALLLAAMARAATKPVMIVAAAGCNFSL
jgi:hypothetical protein